MDFETELKKIPIKKVHLPKIKNPRISVVLPTYNRTHLIAECIESIRRQIIKDFELLIVDDASGDFIEDLLKFYTTNDRRIGYIILKKNVGVGSARNVGNFYARSNFIAVADSDDLYLPQRLELSLQGLEKGADLFYGSYLEADIQGLAVKHHKAKKINMEKFKKRHYTAGGFILAYRKDKAMKTPYRWGIRYNDDFLFLTDWLEAGYKFDFTTKLLGKTRTQREGISMTEALND